MGSRSTIRYTWLPCHGIYIYVIYMPWCLQVAEDYNEEAKTWKKMLRIWVSCISMLQFVMCEGPAGWGWQPQPPDVIGLHGSGICSLLY